MSLYQILGMGLLFVGAVLVVNGIWLLGKASNRDTAVFNLFVGALTLLMALWWAFVEPIAFGDWQSGDPFTAAGTLLFSFTYLWVGINAYTGIEDQRSLGWYCIFVALVTLPNGYFAWMDGDIGLASLWWIWGVLWATFWVLLGLELTEYTTPIAWYTIAVGVVTSVAGYLMGAGLWPWP